MWSRSPVLSIFKGHTRFTSVMTRLSLRKPDAVPEHYREADPMELSIPGARQWILHGKDDDTVPPEFSREYARRKTTVKTAPAGRMENVELVEIARAGHFDLIDPASDAFQQVRSAVVAAGS